MRTYVKLTFTLAFGALAACGEQQPARGPMAAQTMEPAQQRQATTPPTQGSHETMHPQMTQRPALEEPLAPAIDEKPAPLVMTDAQIVAVAKAMNQGEVHMAELGKKNGMSNEVKHFAVMMQSHHGKVLEKTKTVQTKTKLTPDESSELYTKLTNGVSATMTSLKDKKGADFDKAYVDAQVKAHKDVLDALDSRMLPNAQNGELKTHLVEMRRQVAEHLAKAEDIQKKLGATPAKDKAKSEKTDTMGNGKKDLKK